VLTGQRRIEEIQRKLLSWYEIEARDLPWRGTKDPYAILVSEMMLQQTRVETALPYYVRFMERFPTVEVLAEAPVDDVLKVWEGLGYYRRAHNLHAAARRVVERGGGDLPSTVEGLCELPGVGPYTAGAIASIAFDLDEPVLDGNVVRVLSRLFCVPGDTSRAAVRKKLRWTAALVLPRSKASRFNQGLMDLGARVCLPRSPRCHECPLAGQCDAHHTGQEVVYPQKRTRKAIPHVDVVGGIVWDAEPFSPHARILIAKRKANDMLGGLWEFPGGRVENGESHEHALVRELREELAIDVDVLTLFMHLNHAYTHFRITLYVYHCRHIGETPQAIDCAAWTWVRPDELNDYAFPTADRSILTVLQRIAVQARRQPRGHT